MKVLKRKPRSRIGEEPADAGVVKLSLNETGIKKASAKKYPVLKLCQICKKRPWASQCCGKWLCLTCKARTLRKKAGQNTGDKDDLKTTSDSLSIKDIQSGAFKSMLTIQIQSDGKRNVKENPECDELSSEKQFSHKLNIESNEISCSDVIAERSNVENGEKTVIVKDSSVDTKERAIAGTKCSQKSESRAVIYNNSCNKRTENNFIETSKKGISSEKVAMKSKICGVQSESSDIKIADNQKRKSFGSSFFNSSGFSKISEKSGCEFPVADDGSLFGCIESCFDHLEEVDLDLFYEYVCRMKVHSNLQSASKTNRKDIFTTWNFESSVTENNSERHLGSENETNHFCKESSEPSSFLCTSSNEGKTHNELEISNGEKPVTQDFPPLEEIVGGKRLLVNQKQSCTEAKSKHKHSSIEKNKAQVLEQPNKNGLCQTMEIDATENVSSKVSSVKHKSLLSKSNKIKSNSSNTLPDSMSSALQNKFDCNHNFETEFHPKKKSTKEVNTKKLTDCVKLKNNFKKTKLKDQISTAENSCTDENLNSSISAEKQTVGGEHTQHNPLAQQGTTADLINIENETQYSSEKGSISNDLYSNEDEMLDYEPEDEVVLSVETSEFADDLGNSQIQETDFNRVHLLEKESMQDISDAFTQTIEKDDKKERSAWDINSDDCNLDSDDLDISTTPSSPELLLDVEDEEENYIGEKASASQTTPKRSDAQSHMPTSSVPDSVRLEEKLQGEMDSESMSSEDRTKPNFTRNNDLNSPRKKQIPSDDLSMSLQNTSTIKYNLHRLKGYCFQFLRKGICPKKQCKYRHSKPPSGLLNDYSKAEHAKFNQQSGQNCQSVRIENASPGIGSYEERNFPCRVEQTKINFVKRSEQSFPSKHIMKENTKSHTEPNQTRNLPYGMEQTRNNFIQHSLCSEYVKNENTDTEIGSHFGRHLPYGMEQLRNNVITDVSNDVYSRQIAIIKTGRYETNVGGEMFQNTHQNFQQKGSDVLHLVSNDHWNALYDLFDCYFDDGAFVKDLRNSFCFQRYDAGRKFQHFINFVMAQNKQVLEKEKVYMLGQIGCSILLEAHNSVMYEVGFEVLKTLHQYDINYYYLQHNLSHSLDFPLWSIITPSWIALVATDTCLQLEKVSEAIQILEGCNWAVPSPDLTLEVKKKETVERIKVFQKLVEVARKRNFMKLGIKILKMTLDIFSEDICDGDMRNSLSNGIKQDYKYYMSILIENHDIEGAISLYMYFWKLKPSLDLGSDIHRAIIVLAFRNDKKMRARNLFQTCSDMGIYKIGEPNLSSLPHCLRVHTCWTLEEMEMALNYYLGQLLNCLLKWEKNFNAIDIQDLFSLHIVFNESPLKQKFDFYFLSPVRLQESRERMIAAIEKLIFPLEFEQKTERTLHVKPNSLKTYFVLWKIDNGHNDLDKECKGLSSSMRNLMINLSSPSDKLNLERDTNGAKTSNAMEITSGKMASTLLSKKPLLSCVNSSDSPEYPNQDKPSYSVMQSGNPISYEGQMKIIQQEMPVNRNHEKYVALSHQEAICDSELVLHTEVGFNKKTVSLNVPPLKRNKKCNSAGTKAPKSSVACSRVPCIDSTFSFTPPASPPASCSVFVPNSYCQQEKGGKQSKFTKLSNSTSAGSSTLKKMQKSKSYLIAENKTALAMKCFTTPRMSNERKVKLVKRESHPEENLCVRKKQENVMLSLQEDTIMKQNCITGKVYNYIKSQLLCHQKGQSSDDKLNKQAELLTNKFIKENIKKDSRNYTLLDRKSMRTLVDFTKLHISEKNYGIIA